MGRFTQGDALPESRFALGYIYVTPHGVFQLEPRASPNREGAGKNSVHYVHFALNPSFPPLLAKSLNFPMKTHFSPSFPRCIP
jgi:hypothetical protein